MAALCRLPCMCTCDLHHLWCSLLMCSKTLFDFCGIAH